MNKLLVIIGAILTVAGAGLSVFTDIPAAEIVGVGVAFAGAMLTAVTTYKKSEKKDWKVIVSIALTAFGACMLVVANVSETVVSQVITLTIGIVSLISGLITAVVALDKKSE